jgi:hypothetical protein
MLASGVCIGLFDAPDECILRLFRGFCSAHQVGVWGFDAPGRGVLASAWLRVTPRTTPTQSGGLPRPFATV